MSGVAIAVGFLLLLVILVIVFIVTRKKKGASCTPSDAEKAAVGGKGVLTFVNNESGTCVANTCIEGYTLGDGICSKAEVTKKTIDTCTPSDAEKAVAGGEGVLTFVNNESGNCVADTCIEGYTLGDGICSKAEVLQCTGTKAIKVGDWMSDKTRAENIKAQSATCTLKGGCFDVKNVHGWCTEN